MSHTPGPWKWWYQPGEVPERDQWVVTAQDNEVASFLAKDYMGVDLPHAPEDARLIAAAPEMLAALELVLEDGQVPEPLCGYIQDVIDKATGGAQ